MNNQKKQRQTSTFYFIIIIMNHFCYNIIYNSVPLWLAGEMKDLQEMKFPSARLSFTIESEAETERIVKAVRLAARGHAAEPIGEHTKGHYLRGVE